MQQINSSAGLRDAILKLERTQAFEGEILKEQFLRTFDRVKPVNMLKEFFGEAAASKELKSGVLNTVLGLAGGYLSKKFFERVTKSPFKTLVGNAVMVGVANAVEQHPEAVETLGRVLLHIFRRRTSEHELPPSR